MSEHLTDPEPARWLRVVDGLGPPAEELAKMREILAVPRQHDHHGPEPCRVCGGLAPEVERRLEREQREQREQQEREAIEQAEGEDDDPF